MVEEESWENLGGDQKKQENGEKYEVTEFQMAKRN